MLKHHRIAWLVLAALTSTVAHGEESQSSASRIKAASGVAPASTAPMASSAADAMHFRISRYQIEGNVLVDSARLQKIVQSYTGEGRDFGTIQQAVEAIYIAYNDAGYQAVRVIIPEQAMKDGVVKLQIIESKLKRIVVQGNRFHTERNILESLPDAHIGEVPNSTKVEQNLRLANENYSKQTQVTFRATETEGEAEGIARVVDKESGRFAALLDNTGTAATGKYRLGLVYQNANVLDRDHLLSLMYQTSPDKHLSKVTIVSTQYRIPLYSWGTIVELGAGYSNVNSGTINTAVGRYSVAGSGKNYSLHFTKLLPRIGLWDQRASLGIDKRVFNNNVTFAGTNFQLVPGITLNPWSLAYQGSWRGDGEEWELAFSRIKNRPIGHDGDTIAFLRPGQRSGANPRYALWRYNLGYNAAFASGWLLRLQFNGQQTSDALVSGEQFGAGGVDSVRGFGERELSDDRGNRASMEIQTPSLGWAEESLMARTKALLFYDMANLKRNKPFPGEITATTISSGGVGLRMALGKQGMGRLDMAKVLRGGGVRNKGRWMLHAGMSYLF